MVGWRSGGSTTLRNFTGKNKTKNAGSRVGEAAERLHPTTKHFTEPPPPPPTSEIGTHDDVVVLLAGGSGHLRRLEVVGKLVCAEIFRGLVLLYVAGTRDKKKCGRNVNHQLRHVGQCTYMSVSTTAPQKKKGDDCCRATYAAEQLAACTTTVSHLQTGHPFAPIPPSLPRTRQLRTHPRHIASSKTAVVLYCGTNLGV